MHINPILDEGTLLTNGALRSMAIERLPGFGSIVMNNNPVQAGEVMVLINAYGINTSVIDIALEAKKRGVTVIAVTSVAHAGKHRQITPRATLPDKICVISPTWCWILMCRSVMRLCGFRE